MWSETLRKANHEVASLPSSSASGSRITKLLRCLRAALQCQFRAASAASQLPTRSAQPRSFCDCVRQQLQRRRAQDARHRASASAVDCCCAGSATASANRALRRQVLEFDREKNLHARRRWFRCPRCLRRRQLRGHWARPRSGCRSRAAGGTRDRRRQRPCPRCARLPSARRGAAAADATAPPAAATRTTRTAATRSCCGCRARGAAGRTREQRSLPNRHRWLRQQRWQSRARIQPRLGCAD